MSFYGNYLLLSKRRIVMKNGIRFVVVAMFIALCFFYGRAVYESNRAYQAGKEALVVEEKRQAMLHFRHSIQWYIPVGSRAEASFEQLVLLGDLAMETEDLEEALFAYRSARLGIMAIRHIATPLANRLPSLHTKIGSAMSLQTGEPSDQERFETQLNAYPDRRPQPLLGLLASVFFIVWLGSLFSAAWFGFTNDGKIQYRNLFSWLAGSFVAMFLWVICVAFA